MFNLLKSNSAVQMMRAGAAGLLFAFAALPAAGQDQPNLKVADVNGVPIYLDEVIQQIEKLPADLRNQAPEVYFDQLLGEMITGRLAAAKAREQGIDKDADVARKMKQAAEQVLGEAYLVGAIQNAVSEAELQAAYERLVADTASREELRASHILVESEEKAMSLIKQLDGGADFAELAQTHSTGPSKTQGGDLGYFGRGRMVPAFEAAVYDLDIGDHSASPVQTQFGWHVIKLVDKRVQPAPALDAVRAQLTSSLQAQTFATVVEELRAGATIEQMSFQDVRTQLSQQ
ncbi:MAG: peptidylprolyl isomerase [Candidatus Puniceispirillaceae bacterium]